MTHRKPSPLAAAIFLALVASPSWPRRLLKKPRPWTL